jgi:superfamily II DNA/RNA helicase
VPTTSRAGAPRRRSRPRAEKPAAPVRGLAVPSSSVYEVVEDPPGETTFAALGVAAPLVTALADTGCATPFPIQAATLRSSLAGRDVLGRARTGSGKTVAFAVPSVMVVATSTAQRRPGAPRCLVVVPTRELAAQVAATINPLARAMGLRVGIVHGGVSQGPQVSALRRGIDVLVACPGRLEDLIEQRHCTLDAVEVCVLDEADHMADLGFLPAVRRLLDQTPEAGQRLLFSATLDGAVDAIARRYLTDPVVHSVDAVDAMPADLDHHTLTVAPTDKAAVIRELASGRERSLLFTRTKHAAKKLTRDLNAHGIPAVELHGNLSQPQRDRNLAAFAAGSVRVLVATDVAARGIHVDDIALVVHVDPPTEQKAYLHRSGRTARAGSAGTVVTVILPDQTRDVASMIRQAGIRATSAVVAAGAAEILALTGPPATPVYRSTAPARAAAQAAGGPRFPSKGGTGPVGGSAAAGTGPSHRPGGSARRRARQPSRGGTR